MRPVTRTLSPFLTVNVACDHRFSDGPRIGSGIAVTGSPCRRTCPSIVVAGLPAASVRRW